MNKFEHIFKSKVVSIAIKIRTFNIYISSIFLYNSELWNMNTTTAKKIDEFHRRILRYAIGIKWPRKISTHRLYQLTKTEPWRITIKRRRLTFLGHIMRLPIETPV